MDENDVKVTECIWCHIHVFTDQWKYYPQKKPLSSSNGESDSPLDFKWVVFFSFVFAGLAHVMKRVNEILISRMKKATQRLEFIQTGGLKGGKKQC